MMGESGHGIYFHCWMAGLGELMARKEVTVVALKR